MFSCIHLRNLQFESERSRLDDILLTDIDSVQIQVEEKDSEGMISFQLVEKCISSFALNTWIDRTLHPNKKKSPNLQKKSQYNKYDKLVSSNFHGPALVKQTAFAK